MFGITKSISAKVIHTSISKAGLGYAQELESDLQSIIVPPNAGTELEALHELGLVNTTNAKMIEGIFKAEQEAKKQRAFNIEALGFLTKAIEIFGDNIIFISYPRFLELLVKYNLVVGYLKDFTGTIPENSINTLLEARKNLVHKDIIDYSAYYWKIQGISLNRDGRKVVGEIKKTPAFESIHRFPFVVRNMSPEQCFENSDYIWGSVDLFNAYFPEYMNHGDITTHRYRGDGELSNDFFIAAPENEMINKIESVRIRVRPEDPFIISLHKHGVLVHTMWGDEAKDELIAKYGSLVKMISENK
jgi:hypothetical protein